MIPKIIHYVWFGGGEKPELLQNCLKSWQKHCPDYEIKEWNESNFDVSVNKFASEALKHKKYGYVADYIRIAVLKKYGGIYLDTDVEIVKPFDDLLSNDFMISFENGAYCETAVLGSVPNHPLLDKLKQFYEHRSFLIKGKPDLTPNTPIITSFLMKYYGLKPKASTQKLCDLENKNNPTVTVYNYDYFCPINYTTKKLNKTQNTYAIHYFDASWFTKKLKTREKFLKAVYNIFGAKIFTFFTRRYLMTVYKRVNKELKQISL